MAATRVLNPSVLSEICMVRNLSTLPRDRKIQRNLFGAANSVDTHKLFTEEMEKHQEVAIRKWGFDFRSGRPITHSSHYSWEQVSFDESIYTPEVYTLTRAAHLRPNENDVTPFEILLDERSERENVTTIFEVTSYQNNESIIKKPISHSTSEIDNFIDVNNISASKVGRSFKNRQPKITEYMKERKRLAQTPRKNIPSKRLKTVSGHSTGNKYVPFISAFSSVKKNKHTA